MDDGGRWGDKQEGVQEVNDRWKWVQQALSFYAIILAENATASAPLPTTDPSSVVVSSSVPAPDVVAPPAAPLAAPVSSSTPVSNAPPAAQPASVSPAPSAVSSLVPLHCSFS